MKRSDQWYTLPVEKDRYEASKKGPEPAPMPDGKVKPGWKGETKEALLAKLDMLPSDVRNHPRAYLVPPRSSSQAKKSQAFHAGASGVKRKRDSNAEMPPPAGSTATQTLPPPLPRPAFKRPSADPAHGQVVSTSYSWDKHEWTHTYESGASFSTPAQSTTAAPKPEMR